MCKKMLLLLAGFFLLTGCKDDVEIAPVCDCLFVPFIETYATHFSGNPYNGNETYFIKGIAGNIVDGYGCKIKFIEDLKGNFSKKVNTTFTVWGNIDGCRADNFNDYNYQDTLIMLLNPARDRKFKITGNESKPYHEKVGDYVTMGCGISVLKLSENYVTGCILGKIIINHNGYETKICSADTLYYQEFQKLLEEIKQ